jgi:hypothetical protein
MTPLPPFSVFIRISEGTDNQFEATPISRLELREAENPLYFLNPH